MAVQGREHLEDAAKMYEELAKKHPESAYGRLAEKRAEVLNDETKRNEVHRLYQDLDRAIFPFDPRKDAPPAP